MNLLETPLLHSPPDDTSRPPGPTGLDVLRNVARWNANTFRTFVRLAQKWGDIVRVPFTPTRALYMLSRPDYVKHVLQDNHRNYRKAVTYDFLRPVVGNGLLTSHGDLWLRQRRLVAPMFHRRRIRRFADLMVETTRETLDTWERAAQTGQPLDIAAEMSKLTLSIAGKVLFSRNIAEEYERIGEAILLLFRDVNKRIVSPVNIPRSVPTPHNQKVNRAMEDLERIVFEMIDDRRGRAEEFDDLLSMLMLAEDEETGERMDDQQVRDELMTFMLAGHDTTSNALSWALYLLSTHPENRRIAEDEIDLRLEGDAPSFEELQTLDYIEMVIDETLRMYPPAWTIEREPIEDDTIDGYHIPAGSIVMAAPYLVHHNADVWDNPEGFDPERFADEPPEDRHRYAHFPFGGGPRMCVGADFAIMEMKIILPMILRRFRLNVSPGQFVEAEGTVTLYPKDGIDVTIQRRPHP